jgi:excinuclease ABC subunit C
MVVFIDGQPRPQEYRRFRIKTVVGADDFASMAEVLGRRFARWGTSVPAKAAATPIGARGDMMETRPSRASGRADDEPMQGATLPGGVGGVPPTSLIFEAEQRASDAQPDEFGSVEAGFGAELPVETDDFGAGQEPPPGDEDFDEERHPLTGWGSLPDLVIVDGGKGQLSAALDVMRNLGLKDVPLAGLAKQNEELFVQDLAEPIVLPRTSQALYLVQRIRDEAHRFAITYHRKVRSKTGMESALDSVPGIGPKRKRALLRKFGSLRGIREAPVEEIASTVGFTASLAAKVKEYL